MFTFKKIERLCGKKDIDLLYSSGKHKTASPLKIYWRINTFREPVCVRVLISVPKRLFKKAVDRNRIKRQIREVYRLNKKVICDVFEAKQYQADLMILFMHNKHPEIKDIEVSMLKLVEQIRKEIAQDTNKINHE